MGLVRAAALTNFAEVAHELGYEPRVALAGVGLRLSVLREPEQRIATDAVARLLENAAEATGCESFGLRMAQSRALSDLGVLSLLLTHQANLRDALATLIEYLDLLNESLTLFIENAGPMVIVREEVISSEPAPQSIELAIGVLYRLCGALMGDRWRPNSVSFRHQAPRDMTMHRRVFRCRVEFDGEFNGIVCRASDLDAVNATADPGLARYAKQIVEAVPSQTRKSVTLEVRRAIYLMLPSGRVTCAWVAQSLGRSVRTLQRQLDEQGVSFTDLLNEVRRDLAHRYIHNARYSGAQIAELLGYSTHAAFTRWFTAQFGCPPTVRRRQTAARGAS